MKKQRKKHKIVIQDIALMGIMVAMIEVCKVALNFLPNIELVSFWIILFTLFFEWRMIFVIPVFVLIEGFGYGFGMWWFMYLYEWPFLALITYLNRKQKSVWFWSILSSAFGLMFGLMGTIPYVLVNLPSAGFAGSLYIGFTWWVAGIRFDITHCIGNFVIMMICYTPIRKAMERLKKEVQLWE